MNSVDVVVPCYNYARFLRRCVESVLSQQDVTVRVLIIDDASSDDTPEVAGRLAACDRRVEFRRHAANQGHIATYNEGLLGWASAEYSLLLSADDALTPGALARATRLMTNHQEVGMTYGMALISSDDAGMDSPAEEVSESYHIMSGLQFLQHCCEFANPVPSPTAVVRTKLQQRVGGYRADLPHSGDMEMWMRFATQASIGILGAVQAYYRWHGGNMGTAYYESALADLNEQREACTCVLTTWGSAIPAAHRLLATAKRRVGEQGFWMSSKAFDEGDLDRSRICLDFAKEHYRGLRRSGMWWRLQVKRFIGYPLWRRIRPVVDHIRGTRAILPLTKSSHFRVGGLTGWWPGPAKNGKATSEASGCRS